MKIFFFIEFCNVMDWLHSELERAAAIYAYTFNGIIYLYNVNELRYCMPNGLDICERTSKCLKIIRICLPS